MLGDDINTLQSCLIFKYSLCFICGLVTIHLVVEGAVKGAMVVSILPILRGELRVSQRNDS